MIGRSPIIDHEGNIEAYDLHYHLAENDISSARSKSSMLINAVINTFGAKNLLGGRRGFVHVDRKFLLSDTIYSAPKELFVFAIDTKIEIDELLLERLSQLKEKGYFFSLDNMTFSMGPLKRLEPLLEYLDYFKVNTSEFSEVYLSKLLNALSCYDMKIVACKVEDSMQYAISQSIHAPYVQGDYFAEAVIMEKPAFDAQLFNVIQIYNKILSDASVSELVKAFESSPGLTLQLMQFMNSAAFSFKSDISSITQMITLVGIKPLSRWLLLQIYGKSMNHSKYQAPLLLKVIGRTELMQGLYRLIDENVTSDRISQAYFVGVMSLASTVFSVPLRMILKEMSISEEVKNALLNQEGVLGELLTMIRFIEKFNPQEIENFATKHNISEQRIHNLLLDTMQHIDELENSI